MKTTQQAINDSGIPASVIHAVVRRVGRESLADIASHGADAGWAGFTYYTDTVKFFKAHRADIASMVERMADDMGEEPIACVPGFRCLAPMDADTRKSIARCLYGGRLTDDDTNVANALAWFALEEAARAFES